MKRILTLFAVFLVLIGAGCGSNPFDPPRDLVVAGGASRIVLKWKSVPAVIGYNVYRGTASGPVSSKTRIASGLAVTQYVDTAAEPGITYYYQVTAVNYTGDSQASAELAGMIKTAPAGTGLLGGAVQGAPLTLQNEVTTLAGSGTGAADGIGSAAKFSLPTGITTDGKDLFVADTLNHTIRRVVSSTGTVSTLAGSATVSGTADGSGSAARFNGPYGITSDGASLYVTDFFNHMIRRIVIATGEVTTVAGSATPGSADGVGAAAGFRSPKGITTDGANLYVADSGNRRIRKIVIATGAVTTLAGSGVSGDADGAGAAAAFNNPEDLTTDGTRLYLTDAGNHNVRRIDIATADVATLAGSLTPGSSDGIGAAARFNTPGGITTDGTSLYVADRNNNLIRRIALATGTVTTIAGSGSAGSADGTGTGATFSLPRGITTDGVSLFVTEIDLSLIRQIF